MEFKNIEEMQTFVNKVRGFIVILLTNERHRRKDKGSYDFDGTDAHVSLAISSSLALEPLLIQINDGYGVSRHLEVKYLKKILTKYNLKSPYHDWGYSNLAGSIKIQPELFQRLINLCELSEEKGNY